MDIFLRFLSKETKKKKADESSPQATPPLVVPGDTCGACWYFQGNRLDESPEPHAGLQPLSHMVMY